MKTASKEINFHVWTGEPLLAICNHDVTMPGGGHIYGSIGQVNIVEGDVLNIDYGRNMMVYTRSGKSFEAEFPYGKVVLGGTPAYCVLDGKNRVQISLVKGTQDEFNLAIKKQQKRIEPEILELIKVFTINALEKQKEQKEEQKIQNKKQKEIISTTLEKMEKFFKPSKKM